MRAEVNIVTNENGITVDALRPWKVQWVIETLYSSW